MKHLALTFALFLLAGTTLVAAQTTTAPAELQNPSLSPTPSGSARGAGKAAMTRYAEHSTPPRPLSRIGVGVGISTAGINMQVATNLTKNLNVRGVGNYLKYNLNNQSIDNYTVNGTLNLASGGASLDYYPWWRHGFRISPGILAYNDNSAWASIVVPSGTKLTLNNYDYYSSAANPITGNGSIQLNTRKPTPTVTLGWGNLIRRTGHWSFPFEMGAAFMDTPTINMALTGGQACDANGLNCVNVATDATVQSNLQSQISKYRNNMSDYKYYPILSFGVGYSFHVR